MVNLTKKNMPSIILLSPENSGNVGSVSRVMRNFGFEDLILVDPQCDTTNKECRMMAIENYDIIQNAGVFPALYEIYGEFDYLIAFSRRKGSKRQTNGFFHDFLYSLSDRLSLPYDNRKTAFVFGRESSGITKEELSHCSFVVELPADKDKGSMNLSHAVSIACYEYYKFIQFNMNGYDMVSNDFDSSSKSTINNYADEIWFRLDGLLSKTSFYGVDTKENTKYRVLSVLRKSFINELDKQYLIKIIEKLKRLFDN